ncbi:hypothetical protein [Frateuria sp. GZRR33]|uniref:hypothetical protein n=1 Tax=Frateuria sp. GZRR33 TaxID=3351535 RepID=UPI003F734410
MYCPEHLVLKAFGGRLWVWMYWRDVPRETIPLRVWLNPLRYEVSIHAFSKRLTINREGLPAQNAVYRIRVAVRNLFSRTTHQEKP